MLKSKPFRLITHTRTAEVVEGAQLHITVANARKIYLMTDPDKSNVVHNRLILEWLRAIATRILMTDGDKSSYSDLIKDFEVDELLVDESEAHLKYRDQRREEFERTENLKQELVKDNKRLEKLQKKTVEAKEADEKGLTSSYVDYVEQAKRNKER